MHRWCTIDVRAIVRQAKQSRILFCRLVTSDYHSQFIFWLLLLHFITIYMLNQLEAKKMRTYSGFDVLVFAFYCFTV